MSSSHSPDSLAHVSPLTFVFLHEGPHVSLLRAVGEGAVAHVLAFPAILCMDTQLLKDREQNSAPVQKHSMLERKVGSQNQLGHKLHAGEVTNRTLCTSLTPASFPQVFSRGHKE